MNQSASLSQAEALAIVRQPSPASPASYQRACERLAGTLEIPSGFPERTGPREKRFLTIGMTTYNDYDGVFFTIQAIRMFHREVLDDVDFLVIDNGSELPHARSMKALDAWIQQNYRYVPYRSHQATAMKDVIFREATGDFVLVLDSHVFLEPSSLARLIAYLRANPGSNDMLQGLLTTDALKDSNGAMATHLDSIWKSGGFGQWRFDPRAEDPDHPPFEIGKQGLGVFCCRRAAWPGFNPRLMGYGCEEGYIHDKFRRAGGRALCLPYLIWLHRFERPAGVSYRSGSDDRIRNFMLMHDEMGTGSGDMIRHYREHLGRAPADRAVAVARAEIASPFHAFDAVYCIWHEEHPQRRDAMRLRFSELAIERKVRWYLGANTPMDRHIGSVLSHRRILAEARTQVLKSIVVFDGDDRFPPDADAEMTRSLAALSGRDWQISPLDGPAIAYDRAAYDAVLTLVPDDPFAVARLVSGFDDSAVPSMRQLLHRIGLLG